MSTSNNKAQVVIMQNGPYMVTGNVPLVKQIITTDGEGGSEAWTVGVPI